MVEESFEQEGIVSIKPEIMMELFGLHFYPEVTIFGRELVQNAEDAEPVSEIEFTINDNGIIVRNDGHIFDDEDVKRITSLGEGKKNPDLIGMFGIGLRSVYKVTDSPTILSGYRRIHFPSWQTYKITKIDYCQEGSIFQLPFKKFSESDLLQIHGNLFPHVQEMLLFLKNLKKISVVNNVKNRIQSINKIVNPVNVLPSGVMFVEVRLEKSENNEQETEKWLLFKKPLNGPELGQGLSLKKSPPHDASVAIALKMNEDGSLTKCEGKIYATLPTKIFTGFGYNINAKFYTDAPRNNIRQDGDAWEWNRRLIDKIAGLVVESVDVLIKMASYPAIPTKKFCNGLYELLLTDEEQVNGLFRNVYNRLYDFLRSGNVVLTTTKKFVSPAQAFFADESLAEMLGEEYDYVCRDLGFNALNFLRKIGVKRLEVDNLITYLKNEERLAQKESKWFAKVFEYLYKEREGMVKKKEELKKLPIILSQTGELKVAEDIFLPLEAKKETILLSESAFVHSDIVANSNALKFLKEMLDVKEPDVNDSINKYILPAFINLDEDKKRECLAYILKNRLKINNETLENLKKFQLIRSNKGEYVKADGLYLRTEEIEKIFGESVIYVSEEYEAEYWKDLDWEDFFKKLGVEDKPRIKDVIKVVDDLIGKGFEPRMIHIIELIFKALDKRFKSHYQFDSQISVLKDRAWIPTTKGFKKPNETYIDLPTMKQHVGSEVPYLTFKERCENFEDYLGILKEPKPDDVAKFLLKLADEKIELNKDIYEKLYLYLAKSYYRLSYDNMIELKTKEIIFLSQRKIFMKPENVFLTDWSEIFGEYRGYITEYPSDCRMFFTYVGVKETPHPDDYARFLMEPSEKGYQVTPKVILQIYERLGPQFYDINRSLREKLNISKIVLTEKGVILRPFETFIPDNDKLRELFKEDINIAKVTRDGILFLEKLGVRKLSQCVRIEPSVQEPFSITDDTKDLEERIHKVLHLFERLEYAWKISGKEIYTIGWKERLYQLTIRASPKVEITYTIDAKSKKVEDYAAYLEGRNMLVISGKLEEILASAAREIAFILRKIRDGEWTNLSTKIALIIQNPYNADSIMEQLGVPLVTLEEKPIERGSVIPEVKVEVTPTIEKREEFELPTTLPIIKPVVPKQIEVPTISSEKIEHVKKALMSELPPKVIIDIPPTLDEIVEETTKVLKEETEGHRIDARRIFKPAKDISAVRTQGAVRHTLVPTILSPKNWERRIVEDEEIFVEQEIENEIPDILKIKEFRKLIARIVETMGGNSKTIKICVAKKATDGYNEDGQLFFNVVREDTRYRWFAVVARELAHNYSPICRINPYMHIKVMIDLIEKGLERIDEIYPEFKKT
ncbi:MAG: DUF3684 domain-containing protein [archaeon]|nr:DUF3684 domain-containing protein [archaeon]